MKRINFIIWSCLLLIPVLTTGQEGVMKFEAANTDYRNKNYTEAIDKYHSLLNEGWESAELEFNLANAYYQLDELGLAIVHFERARKLKPADKRISNNLNLARNKVDSEIIEVPDFVLLRIWNSFCVTFSPGSWMILQLFISILSLVSIYFWRFGQTRKSRITGFGTGLIFFIFFVISLFAGYWRAHDLDSARDGIVLEDSYLRSGPDKRSDQLKSIPEGEKVEVIDELGDWYKVELLNKETGWLAIGIVEFI